MKNKRCFFAFLLFIACIAAFAYHGMNYEEEHNDFPSEQLHSGDPYQFLMCQSPISVQFFQELDSTDLLLDNESDLNWISDILDGLELSYDENIEPLFGTNDLYAIIDFENGDTFSLTFNDKNQLIIDGNSTIGGQNIGSPPAGVYTLNEDGLFDTLMDTYDAWQHDKNHNRLLSI